MKSLSGFDVKIYIQKNGYNGLALGLSELVIWKIFIFITIQKILFVKL